MSGRKLGSKNKQQKISENMLVRLIRKYKKGASTEELGVVAGVSAGTISTHLKRAGIELRKPGFQKGSKHHAWVGGRHIGEDGYVRVWLSADDLLVAMAQRHGSCTGGYALEHRVVMAKKLGRLLLEDETVHHKDGDRKNNDPDNLQLRQGKHGKGGVFRCCDCGSHNVVAEELEEAS
jgi:hypothetical protein